MGTLYFVLNNLVSFPFFFFFFGGLHITYAVWAAVHSNFATHSNSPPSPIPPELFGSTETFRERTTDHQHFGFSKMTVTTVEISRSELSSVNCHARHGFRGGAARARTRYFRP